MCLTDFSKSFGRLLRILKNSPVPVAGKVREGDARTLRGIRSASVDAVITSPPYLNAIDYLRGHKLALVWIGYGSSDIKRIKSLGVGARTQHDRHAPSRVSDIIQLATVSELPPKAERVVRTLRLRYAGLPKANTPCPSPKWIRSLCC